MTDERARHVFSAKFNPVDAISLPTSAPIRRIRDVIVCPTMPTDDVSLEEVRAHPPIGSPVELGFAPEAVAPVELGRSATLDRMSNEDAALVMNACSPRGHYFVPIRQFGQRFSFVRDVDVAEGQHHRFQFDADGVLSDALTMSRLIRDNGYSLQFAARVTDFDDGEQLVAYSGAQGGKAAYRLRRDRDWLDVGEAHELRSLLEARWAAADSLRERVRRAMWRAEYASWLPWADLALPVLVGGLESLLKTERHHATWQFTTRVPALAVELGFDGVTEDFCERMYDARSEWVHGTHVRLFSVGQPVPQAAGEEGPDDVAQWSAVADIARVQDLLRRAVRRCIEDGDFRAVFADDDSIRARWPL